MLKQSRCHLSAAENGLKGRFPGCRMQRNTRNACTRKTPKIAMHAKNRIDSIACVHCIFRFFDCVASRATVALSVLHTTTWKRHVGLCKRTNRLVFKLPYATQRMQHTLFMRHRSKNCNVRNAHT